MGKPQCRRARLDLALNYSGAQLWRADCLAMSRANAGRGRRGDTVERLERIS
jgi:hypothetical protein